MEQQLRRYGLVDEWSITLAKFIMEGFPQPGEEHDSSTSAMYARLMQQGERGLAEWLETMYDNPVLRAIEILDRCAPRGQREEKSIFTALLNAYEGRDLTLLHKKFIEDHLSDFWKNYKKEEIKKVDPSRKFGFEEEEEEEEEEKKGVVYPSKEMSNAATAYEDFPVLNNPDAASLYTDVMIENEERFADEIDTYIERLTAVYNGMGFAPITKVKNADEFRDMIRPEIDRLRAIEASKSSSAPPPEDYNNRVYEARDSMGAVVPV